MSKTPVLQVKALSKKYDALRVLDGIEFQLMPGEVVGLIGPNGSGKSTTLDIIAGRTTPGSGQVLLRGQDIAGLSPEAIAERGLTRTFQNGRVFGNSTVRENVLVGLMPKLGALRPFAVWRNRLLLRWIPLLAETLIALIRPVSARKAELRLEGEVRKGLARFGERLLPRLHQATWQLSYANRRRTEIARALASKPEILLLDEPTAGMNPAETQEMLHQLLELKAQGQAMLLVEHKLELVMAVSDRVIVLDGGKLIAQGSPLSVSQDQAVIEAYLGKRLTQFSSRAPVKKSTRLLLEIENLNVFYGRFHALQDVSLRVNEGEIVCLLGGNASGKSTTLKALFKLIRHDSGSIRFSGCSTELWSSAQLVKAGIASVPEARRVFSEMTVEENLFMGAYTRRDQAGIREDLEKQYALFPRLKERRLQHAGTLSGGEQQMLALARALMSRPRLICMDEPTMGLSPKLVEEVLEYIQKINHELGISILMIEQNAELALSIAHRGYVLQTGVMRLNGKASDLLQNPAVKEAYLGHPQAVQPAEIPIL